MIAILQIMPNDFLDTEKVYCKDKNALILSVNVSFEKIKYFM